ncbi:MAG: GntR family transcriptional regulator [Desulfuromonadaceae bacterium]|nr:GntR family transcriptional regulator [Desulfuromonadaceae bacterium]
MIKVHKQRLSHQVYDILKEMIADYRFSPGARINVEQIAKEVGASRTPVWEAVHRLIQEGLLENIPNRGVFMLALTPKMAIELYVIREALEGLAARCAIPKVNEQVLKKMAKLIEEQRKVVAEENLVGYSQLDYEFHSLVYELSGNRTLLEILGAVKNKMRPVAFQIKPILSRLLEDHMEILAAFQDRDSDRAEAAFRNHNLKMIEQIKQTMNPDEWEEVQVEYGVGKKSRNSDVGDARNK